jgi:hypothetical protein
VAEQTGLGDLLFPQETTTTTTGPPHHHGGAALRCPKPCAREPRNLRRPRFDVADRVGQHRDGSQPGLGVESLEALLADREDVEECVDAA